MPPGVALRLWGEPWAGSLAPVSSLMMRLTAASHPQGSWAVLDALNKRARTFLLGPFTIVEGQRKTLATLPAAPALEPGWLCLRSPVCQASSPDGGRQTGPRDPPPCTFPSGVWREHGVPLSTGQPGPGQGAGLLWSTPVPQVTTPQFTALSGQCQAWALTRWLLAKGPRTDFLPLGGKRAQRLALRGHSGSSSCPACWDWARDFLLWQWARPSLGEPQSLRYPPSLHGARDPTSLSLFSHCKMESVI